MTSTKEPNKIAAHEPPPPVPISGAPVHRTLDSLPAPDYGKQAVIMAVASKYPDPWLDWFEGCIYTKNPDKAIVAKMIQIAQQLGARVQGDDGEFYEDTSEIPD